MKKSSFLFLFVLVVFLTRVDFSISSDIKGKVTIKQRVEKKRKSGLSGFYTKPKQLSAESDPGDRDEVVLYIKRFANAPPPTPVLGAKLLQENKKFVPHILPVVEGTTVEFPNMDEIYHNVFSLTRNNSFNLGKYAAGLSKPKTFTKEGLVEVFCEIHSDMHAYILVLPNNYFAKTDAEGNYVIKNVPPGTYTLVAWHEFLPPKEFVITVTPGEDVVHDIEF